MTLLEELNQSYHKVHFEKEDAFWRDKMDLKSKVPGEFEAKETVFQAFVSDAGNLPRIRKELERQDLSDEERVGLGGWLRFFTSNAVENPEALALQEKIIHMEGELAKTRQAMALGYRDPQSGETVPASSVKLSLILRTSPDEALRRAAHQGLQSIEREVLAKGFLDIVKERNRLGKLLGYEDYYDYKVSRNEGFSKRKLFEALDDLERQTRDSCRNSVTEMEKKMGYSAREGYNFPYFIAGDLTAQMDPYFGFASALGRWGRTFMGLGIQYNGCHLTLDLLDRKGKYENGFMHGPVPAVYAGGKFSPAHINFTANAIPGQVGSGHRALETLLHEGGHAAHFSNIRMPAPCFSQEYAPTSVAFAETQSMFLDSLGEDPDWLVRHAKTDRGESMPEALILQNVEQKHPYKAFQIRAMLTICFAERAIYEMPESSLTPENVLRTLRETETELQFLKEGTRPVLSVPHLLSGESSAYYHGYVLAEMAVHQTRRHFFRRDGHILDNPAVGRDLAEHYWKPGNAKTFFEMVEGLTGEPFSADAIVENINRPLAEALNQAREAMERERNTPLPTAPVDLNAHIRLMHGDEPIAGNENGESFQEIEQKFAAWLEKK